MQKYLIEAFKRMQVLPEALLAEALRVKDGTSIYSYQHR